MKKIQTERNYKKITKDYIAKNIKLLFLNPMSSILQNKFFAFVPVSAEEFCTCNKIYIIIAQLFQCVFTNNGNVHHNKLGIL